MDGTIKWASSDPNLLWALRGGGGRFGVVTAFKLRAHTYPQNIYSGMILFPREALSLLADKVSRFAQENTDPKVAAHFYCLDLTNGAFVGKESVLGLGLLPYDAHGEEHGRESFKWALEIPGAVDTTKGMSYREVNKLNGKSLHYYSSTLIYSWAVKKTERSLGFVVADSKYNRYDRSNTRPNRPNDGKYPKSFQKNYSRTPADFVAFPFQRPPSSSPKSPPDSSRKHSLGSMTLSRLNPNSTPEPSSSSN
jgi:hypothetical protein